MSNIVSAMVQRRRAGSLTKKAILLYMADRASDDGTGIWSSKAHIAADLEITKRAVQQNVQELVTQGLLIVAGQKPCPRGYTVEYCIDLGAVALLDPTRETDGAGANHVHGSRPTGEPRSPHGRTTFTPTGEPRSPKPPYEPSYEPSLLAGMGVDPDPAPKKEPNKSRIKEGWTPSDRNIADAQAAGLTEEEIAHEAKQFTDYHLGRGSLQADWNATWRTWCRNAIKFRKNPRGVAGGAGKPGGGGQGASMASIAMRRRIEGQI